MTDAAFIAQEDVEKLATDHVQQYVNGCHCKNTADIGSALTKMLAVTAQAIIATQGQQVAVTILLEAAKQFSGPEFSKPYSKEIVQ